MKQAKEKGFIYPTHSATHTHTYYTCISICIYIYYTHIIYICTLLYARRRWYVGFQNGGEVRNRKTGEDVTKDEGEKSEKWKKKIRDIHVIL